VLVDSSCREARHALAEKPEVWKVNRHELAEIVGHPVDDMPERIRAYRTLATRFGVRWVMASHGAEGMECFNGSVLRHAVPPRVRVVNSIGSGDAATAGVAWVLDARGDGCPAGDLLDSDDCAREALVTATAMGTANCLNAVNGKVLREDFTRIRDQVRVREIPLA
jgi:fructose-1-phosphate kinase PfkB-like protein